jgi:hypothetical protein
VGDPNSPDGVPGFHAIALSFQQANGEIWRTAMDDTPIFPIATPQSFIDFQLATAPNKTTGKPNPERVQAYMAAHPETRAFVKWLHDAPFAASFAASTYYSINAFRFTNSEGQTRAVRWSLKPEAPFVEIDKAKLADLNKTQPNFLFDDAIQRLSQQPLRWELIVTLAQPGDRCLLHVRLLMRAHSLAVPVNSPRRRALCPKTQPHVLLWKEHADEYADSFLACPACSALADGADDPGHAVCRRRYDVDCFRRAALAL